MSLASTDFAVVERFKASCRIFAHTHLDAISVVGALLHCAYFFGKFYLFPAFRFGGSDLRLFEMARVLVRVNHVARFIINADHGIM
jgi:hypothetical protein